MIPFLHVLPAAVHKTTSKVLRGEGNVVVVAVVVA